jgi:ATP/maltotriose-dependent transcriptional regulator MalT
MSMAYPLLRTKLNKPRLSRTLVRRSALVQRIYQVLEGYLARIPTPARFGKTTLAAERANQSVRRVAWLSWDESDNEHDAPATVTPLALEQAGLMSNALDSAGEWYVNHALFRDLLRQTLQGMCPPEEIAHLDARTGIDYHGLFLGLTNEVIVAGASGIQYLRREVS